MKGFHILAANLLLVLFLASPAFAGGAPLTCQRAQEGALAITICKNLEPSMEMEASSRHPVEMSTIAVREGRVQAWMESAGPALVSVTGSGYANGEFSTRYTLVTLLRF